MLVQIRKLHDNQGVEDFQFRKVRQLKNPGSILMQQTKKGGESNPKNPISKARNGLERSIIKNIEK